MDRRQEFYDAMRRWLDKSEQQLSREYEEFKQSPPVLSQEELERHKQAILDKFSQRLASEEGSSDDIPAWLRTFVDRGRVWLESRLSGLEELRAVFDPDPLAARSEMPAELGEVDKSVRWIPVGCEVESGRTRLALYDRTEQGVVGDLEFEVTVDDQPVKVRGEPTVSGPRVLIEIESEVDPAGTIAVTEASQAPLKLQVAFHSS